MCLIIVIITRPVLTGNGNRSPFNSGSGNRALVGGEGGVNELKIVPNGARGVVNSLDPSASIYSIITDADGCRVVTPTCIRIHDMYASVILSVCLSVRTVKPKRLKLK